MPFDHNAHYHRLLLRRIPAGASTALDVGCGTGTLARRLARTCLHVDAVDADPAAINFARAAGCPGRIPYRCADITDLALPSARNDLITCGATLHHVPFDTLTRLTAALRPGGVLLVLGLAAARSPAPLLRWGLMAPPPNLLVKAVVATGGWCNGGPDPVTPTRLRNPDMSQVQRSPAVTPGHPPAR